MESLGATLGLLSGRFDSLCCNFSAIWFHFGVGLNNLEALCGRSGYVKVTFAYFGLPLVTWWSHFGYINVGFQRMFICQMGLNDFM